MSPHSAWYRSRASRISRTNATGAVTIFSGLASTTPFFFASSAFFFASASAFFFASASFFSRAALAFGSSGGGGGGFGGGGSKMSREPPLSSPGNSGYSPVIGSRFSTNHALIAS